VDGARDAHAARLGEPFETRRDVDAFAEDIPMRNSICFSSATALFRSAMSRWISTAQSVASTALANSASTPSPVDLTTRP
jgi:hypothetical protein